MYIMARALLFYVLRKTRRDHTLRKEVDPGPRNTQTNKKQELAKFGVRALPQSTTTRSSSGVLKPTTDWGIYIYIYIYI